MKKNIEFDLQKAKEYYNDPEGFKKLLIDTFSKEELEKEALPKSWEELKNINSYFITSFDGTISKFIQKALIINDNKNLFVTEKQAKSALAKAQLSQLIKVYNGDWEADWKNSHQNKFVIFREKNDLTIGTWQIRWTLLAFPTKELRDEFFENFQELIKEYYEI